MKRLFTLALIASFACQVSQAQDKPSYKKFQLGIGLETALPIGAFGTGYSVGVGSTLRATFGLSDKIAVTATSGVMAFIPKTVKGVDLKAQLNIPYKAGVKYMFTKKVYGLGEVGATTARVYYPTTTGAMNSVSSTSFTYAANIGTHLGKFDASLRYEGYRSSGFIGLRLGLNF